MAHESAGGGGDGKKPLQSVLWDSYGKAEDGHICDDCLYFIHRRRVSGSRNFSYVDWTPACWLLQSPPAKADIDPYVVGCGQWTDVNPSKSTGLKTA